MIGGVTRHMLPHLPVVPHLQVKRLLDEYAGRLQRRLVLAYVVRNWVIQCAAVRCLFKRT